MIKVKQLTEAQKNAISRTITTSVFILRICSNIDLTSFIKEGIQIQQDYNLFQEV